MKLLCTQLAIAFFSSFPKIAQTMIKLRIKAFTSCVRIPTVTVETLTMKRRKDFLENELRMTHSVVTCFGFSEFFQKL